MIQVLLQAINRMVAASTLLALSVTAGWANAPTTPLDLIASVADGSVTLTWSPSSDNTVVAGYNVYRQDQYIDTVAGTTYQGSLDTAIENVFYVVAFDAPAPGEGIRFSAKSERIIVSPVIPPIMDDKPTTPSNVQTLRVTEAHANVFWSPSIDNEAVAGYNVYRDNQYLTTVFDTSYDDFGVLPGQPYSYYIVAFDEPRNFSNKSSAVSVAAEPAGSSDSGTDGTDTAGTTDQGTTDLSSTDGVGTSTPDGSDGSSSTGGGQDAGSTDSPTDGGGSGVDPTLPTIPTNLSAGVVTDSVIELLWEESVDDSAVLGYNVYRDNQYITTVFTAQFIDRTLPVTSSDSYEYHVVAYDDDYNFTDPSIRFAIAKATAAPDPALPLAPANLTTSLASNDWIGVQWDPVPGVDTYNVYRNNVLIFTVQPDDTNSDNQRYADSYSYIDCNYTRAYERCLQDAPSPGVRYIYRVTAVDANGNESLPSFASVNRLLENEGDIVNLNEYELRFADEFDSESLNHSAWNTRLPWGPETFVNGEKQYFVDYKNNPDFGFNPFQMTGDTLSIQGIVTPDDLLTSASNQPYLSGVITTRDSFTMTYGYVEARARFAHGVGTLSSFFLFHQWTALNSPEIDIVEYLGQTPDISYQTYHYYDEVYTDVLQSSPTMMNQSLGINLDEDFHTYSVLWEPELVVWYIDGEEIRRIAGPEVSRQRMYITAYLVMGSEWVPSPDVNSDLFPASYEIDYIRAYQKPNNQSFENSTQ